MMNQIQATKYVQKVSIHKVETNQEFSLWNHGFLKLGTKSQKDHKFKASLGYIVRPYLKKKNNNKNNNKIMVC